MSEIPQDELTIDQQSESYCVAMETLATGERVSMTGLTREQRLAVILGLDDPTESVAGRARSS